MYYCESFTESKFDEKYASTMESTTSNVWNKTFENKSIAKDHQVNNNEESTKYSY